MRRARMVAGLVLAASLLAAGPARAYHGDRDRCYRHECRYDDGGDGYNDGGGSDGNSGGDYEGGKSGDTDQHGDHNCRNFCFYGIPAPGGGDQPPSHRPEGFIPPNPGKIPQQIADFVKVVSDFVQAVLRFAV